MAPACLRQASGAVSEVQCKPMYTKASGTENSIEKLTDRQVRAITEPMTINTAASDAESGDFLVHSGSSGEGHVVDMREDTCS